MKLRSLPIAFLRHIGPYEDVGDALWARLNAWADSRGFSGDRMLLGIGHDAPGLTPAEKLRFDACISVPEGTQPRDGVHIGRLPELLCAVTTHVGAYATMPEAYRAVVDQLRALPRVALLGLPAIEIYRDTSVDVLREISTTDIYLPVRREP
ncbi:MAG: GyrI-like domain-containing protein [Pseudomonadota bacterium]